MWTIAIYDAGSEKLSHMWTPWDSKTLFDLEELKQRTAAFHGEGSHVYLVDAEIPPETAREGLAAEWKWRNKAAVAGLNALKARRN